MAFPKPIDGSKLPLDTKGDLIVFGKKNERLPVGTNGQVLTADSAQALGVKWATPSGGASPACHVYHDAQQEIANRTDTVLAFNSERFDTDSIHDNSANNSRLTCKTAGKYLISGHAEFTQHATGLRTLWILLNGTTILAMQKVPGTSVSNNNTTISIQTMWDLEVNDYVELWVRQASGTSLNVLAVNSSPQFMMVKVG